MNNIHIELDKIGINPEKTEEIRRKDGIFLYRIYWNNQSYVLKYFDDPEDTREILYYDLLRRSGVPTLEVIGNTDRAILMEDLLASPRWRLGAAMDLDDPLVAEYLARWYRTLHDASSEILAAKADWYSEYGLLTPEKLRLAAERTGTAQSAIWEDLIGHLPRLKQLIGSLDPVVNYNDFYYTNLAVSRDGREAMMFDYNCMGKGYRAADVRNVCWSLGDRAAQAFLQHYGNVPEYEYQVDDVVSTLTTLVMASSRPEIPNWANDAVQALKSGRLYAKLQGLIAI